MGGFSHRRVIANVVEHRYSMEYRRENAEHVDSEHSLEDIVYIRNTPYVASILKMVKEDYLSREDYPFLLKPPSDYAVMEEKPSHTVDKEVLADFTPKRRRRLILVVIGGLTYTELHHLRTLSKYMKQKLVVVTTSMMNPQSFIKTLSEISMWQLSRSLIRSDD